MANGESTNVKPFLFLTHFIKYSHLQHVNGTLMFFFSVGIPFAVDYLLFIVRDVKVQPNPDEVADIKYVSREELKELVKKADAGEEGLKLSPWFRLVVDNFLMKWWDHVEKGTLAEAIDMKTIHKL